MGLSSQESSIIFQNLDIESSGKIKLDDLVFAVETYQHTGQLKQRLNSGVAVRRLMQELKKRNFTLV